MAQKYDTGTEINQMGSYCWTMSLFLIRLLKLSELALVSQEGINQKSPQGQ